MFVSFFKPNGSTQTTVKAAIKFKESVAIAAENYDALYSAATSSFKKHISKNKEQIKALGSGNLFGFSFKNDNGVQEFAYAVVSTDWSTVSIFHRVGRSYKTITFVLSQARKLKTQYFVDTSTSKVVETSSNTDYNNMTREELIAVIASLKERAECAEARVDVLKEVSINEPVRQIIESSKTYSKYVKAAGSDCVSENMKIKAEAIEIAKTAIISLDQMFENIETFDQAKEVISAVSEEVEKAKALFYTEVSDFEVEPDSKTSSIVF